MSKLDGVTPFTCLLLNKNGVRIAEYKANTKLLRFRIPCEDYVDSFQVRTFKFDSYQTWAMLGMFRIPNFLVYMEE